MRKINLRQALMLTAAGVMVVMLITVLGRMGTQKLLVKDRGVDNVITQTVLSGTEYGNSQEDRWRVRARTRESKVDWQRRYPFSEIEKPDMVVEHKTDKERHASENESWLVSRVKKIIAWPIAKARQLVKLSKNKTRRVEKNVNEGKKEISRWTGNSLLGYYELVEMGRTYEAGFNWQLMNPSRGIVALEDEVWTGITKRFDQTERADSIAELSQFMSQLGGIHLCAGTM